MGMAASQARFLGLTARKTNTEYEGQQINQQRTALSNKSAAYYNDLLTMKVPTAPSAVDYTTTVYSFTNGQVANQLTSMIALADGSYTVSYLRTYTDDQAIVDAVPMIITRDVAIDPEHPDDPPAPTGYFRIGSDYLRGMDDWDGFHFYDDTTQIYLHEGKFYEDDTFEHEYTVTGTLSVQIEEDSNFNTQYYRSLTAEQLKGMSFNESQYLMDLHDGYGQPDHEWVLRYILNTTTNAYEPYFYNKSIMESPTFAWDDNNRSIHTLQAFTVGSAVVSKEITGVHAFLEQDSTGRYTNITIENEGTTLTYALSTNTITDSAAYQDAMNQYEYNKAQYDKSIQEVNAKIEIIQAEDKNLELRLKQLDTEQKAIQTEIDAVTSVIKKNVETSFKTFNA